LDAGQAGLKRYVINLDRSPGRLLHMRREFERLGLEFERIAAVDGALLPDQVIERIGADHRWVRPLVPAEIGCFLSHRACWEAIAADDAPCAAVFEDDVHLSDSARDVLGSHAWVPADADFIKLETRHRPVTVGIASRYASGAHRLVRLYSFHDGLGGYVLSRRCAQRLVSYTQRCTAPVDQLVLNPQYEIFDRLVVFQLTPAICTPRMAQRPARRVLVARSEPAHTVNGGDACVTVDGAGPAGAAGAASVIDHPAIVSTIDPDGELYRHDEATLQKRGTGAGGRIMRKLSRILASVERGLRGRHRTRVGYTG